MAGWNLGAKQKPIPTASTVAATWAPSRSILTPRASRRSAAPDFEEAARAPCLTTVAPAALAMIAAVVEILMVFAPSPPVPTGSTALWEMEIGAQCWYITETKDSTSRAVSPLAWTPKRKDLMLSFSARSPRISPIAHWAWRELRSSWSAS